MNFKFIWMLLFLAVMIPTVSANPDTWNDECGFLSSCWWSSMNSMSVFGDENCCYNCWPDADGYISSGVTTTISCGVGYHEALIDVYDDDGEAIGEFWAPHEFTEKDYGRWYECYICNIDDAEDEEDPPSEGYYCNYDWECGVGYECYNHGCRQPHSCSEINDGCWTDGSCCGNYDCTDRNAFGYGSCKHRSNSDDSDQVNDEIPNYDYVCNSGDVVPCSTGLANLCSAGERECVSNEWSSCYPETWDCNGDGVRSEEDDVRESVKEDIEKKSPSKLKQENIVGGSNMFMFIVLGLVIIGWLMWRKGRLW
jgi:hypothetical protein